MKKKCVIFDIDGTLIDTEEVTVKALKLTLKKLYDKEYNEEELSFAIGLPGRHTLARLGVEDIDNTLLHWGEQIQKFSNKVRIYPQIEETINILKEKKIKLGIVTSRYDYEVKEDIILNKMLHHFDVIVTYDESLKPKPYPDQLLKALKKFDITPKDAVYVGDTLYDYECAKNASVDFILANWGKVDRKNNFDDNNIKVCNKPTELLDNIMGG